MAKEKKSNWSSVSPGWTGASPVRALLDVVLDINDVAGTDQWPEQESLLSRSRANTRRANGNTHCVAIYCEYFVCLSVSACIQYTDEWFCNKY